LSAADGCAVLVRPIRRHLKRRGHVTLQGQRPNIQRTAGILSEILRELGLIWRLMVSRQVPLWTKLVPLAIVLYIISPIDVIPDPILGLGQIDDVALLLLGSQLFIAMCPRDVVQRLRQRQSAGAAPDDDAEVVDGTYRVLDE
jgi:uncharacterized membrane protein YkvA (DUF1232 family)